MSLKVVRQRIAWSGAGTTIPGTKSDKHVHLKGHRYYTNKQTKVLYQVN